MLVRNGLAVTCGDAAVSVIFDCVDLEYVRNGAVFYGSEPSTLVRSGNALTFKGGATLSAMHDSAATIRCLNGSRAVMSEREGEYSYAVSNGDSGFTLKIRGNCRCDENKIIFRRGRTEIEFPEPIRMECKTGIGFEYEANKCLGIIGDISVESELLPLLIAVDGMKNARFDKVWADSIMKIIPTMSDENKTVARKVMKHYYRVFGYDEMN